MERKGVWGVQSKGSDEQLSQLALAGPQGRDS